MLYVCALEDQRLAADYWFMCGEDEGLDTARKSQTGADLGTCPLTHRPRRIDSILGLYVPDFSSNAIWCVNESNSFCCHVSFVTPES